MKKICRAKRHPVIGIIGVILCLIPLLLMLGTGSVASIMTGRLLIDYLLPAELFYLILPGMVMMVYEAFRQKRCRRLLLVILVMAIVALAGCQLTAVWTGLATGQHPAEGAAWYLVIILLAVYDFAAVAAPAAGIYMLIGGRKDSQ